MRCKQRADSSRSIGMTNDSLPQFPGEAGSDAGAEDSGFLNAAARLVGMTRVVIGLQYPALLFANGV